MFDWQTKPRVDFVDQHTGKKSDSIETEKRQQSKSTGCKRTCTCTHTVLKEEEEKIGEST